MNNLKRQDELNYAKELILFLQGRLSSVQARRKEILQSRDDEKKGALKEQCQKLSHENMVMENKMRVITMRISKEIEDQKKKEENLVVSLKKKFEECGRLVHENDMLKTNLVQSKSNEQELQRQIIILREHLTTMSEYKEKFKISSAQLDELLKRQRQIGDSSGLGFEKGQSSDIANEDQNHKESIKQFNAYKFNGRCFVCNRFGHMARQCRNTANHILDCSPGKCSKCNKYGHKIEDCRMNVKFYACGKSGHMANQCRSRNFTGFRKAIQRNNVTCCACNDVGHIAKFCRSRNPSVGNGGSNEKGKEKVSEFGKIILRDGLGRLKNNHQIEMHWLLI